MSVLVVGSVALDTIEAPAGRADEALGGSATYFSLAASYFTGVHLVGAIGGDFPARHVELLSGAGVDTAGLVTRKGDTFRWTGRYEENLNDRTTLSVDLGVFEGWQPEVPAEFRAIKTVFLANSSPQLQMAVLDQMEAPDFVAADTMNLYLQTEHEGVLELMKRIDCFILNDEEAVMLTGETSLIKAARAILDMGPASTIIKKGVHGSITVQGEDVFLLPAFPLQREVDPTGAGDSFAGAFCGTVATLGRSRDALRKAAAYATVTASFCVEDFSVDRYRDLSRADIDARYEEFARMTQIESA